VKASFTAAVDRLLVLAGVAALVWSAAAAGASTRRALPYRTLAHDVYIGASEAGRPHVAIAVTRAQLLGRIGPLQEPDVHRVRKANVRRFAVVGAFGGVDMTCCGRVTIRRMWTTGRQLCVVADRLPAGNTGLPSQPYQVVTVRRALLGKSPPRAWRLIRPDGSTLAGSRGSRRCA
jgi:hypothetical protein